MSKKEEAERLRVAKELCQKEGKDWDALDDYGKHSYLHYADVVIRKALQEPKKPTEEVPTTPSNQCPVCDGKGFIEEQHGLVQVECEACGGTGIAKAEEKPEEKAEEKPARVHKHYYPLGSDTCRCGHVRRKKKAK